MPSLQLRVTISTQTIEVWRDGDLFKSYPVSTSKFGLGTEVGSFKTPLGAFQIREKYGAKEDLHVIFKGRRPAGEWNPDRPSEEEDLILTRILHLHGLEEENSNSYDRYIYIHGTNQEEQIGTPASHGCIRMKKSDVAELYDLVPLGTAVRISLT